MNIKREKAIRLILVLILAWHAQTVQGVGLTCPASQFFLTFATPAATIDCIVLNGLPTTQQALFTSLEGIVNRTQPQIACVYSASKGEFTWMSIHNLSSNVINGSTVIQKWMRLGDKLKLQNKESKWHSNHRHDNLYALLL